jgi:3-oxoacyl-[acyl-carrier protein] reductase
MSTKKLTGKVAVVTGASKGIGAAIARHLAAEGATVVVNYSASKEGAERVVSEVNAAGGKAIAVKANLAKKADIDQLFAETKRAFGPIDILVNNAGIYEFAPVEEISDEHYQKQFDLNVRGLALATQAAVKQFNPAGGSIINISSIVSTHGIAGAAIYSGTKGAVDAMTRAWARELGPRGIRVNAINPGMIETEGVHAAGIAESELRKQVEVQTPLGRIGQPEEIATVATFFASQDSAWVTGQTLNVAGGYI